MSPLELLPVPRPTCPRCHRPGSACWCAGLVPVETRTRDGTWPQARKMPRLNPALRGLPRIGFVPATPGNYRIRREPAAHCVATVGTVIEVLTAMEGDRSRFAPLLASFNSMVERQIEGRATRTHPVPALPRPAAAIRLGPRRVRGRPPIRTVGFQLIWG